MLQRQHRLLAQVRLQHPLSFRSSTFIAKVAKNDKDSSRFGVIVRKALDKRATKRNRVRRVFRSCIEQLLDQIVPAYDMLFILQKESLAMNREQFLQELTSFLKKNNLLV